MRRLHTSVVAVGFALALSWLTPAGCSRRPTGGVVLYSSMDSAVLTPIIEQYQQRTGVRVDVVTDTEATKTTGLVNRLIAEKERPRADVWWSGEVVGTVQLERAGVLDPWQPPRALAAARAAGFDRWPIGGKDHHWHGLALRARVLVYRTGNLPGNAAAPPRSLEQVAADGSLLAIANPAFGTTRGHIAALYAELGEQGLADLLGSLKLKVYDGNATVVRAVASGEAPLGLTDYDDYLAGVKNGWPLGVVFITAKSAEAERRVVASPGSVALVKGGTNPAAARDLVEFILSAQTEEALARSGWGSVPALQRTPADGQPPFAVLDWERITDDLAPALAVWQRVRSQSPGAGTTLPP